MGRRSTTRTLKQTLAGAESYDEWLTAARALDTHLGLAQWRRDPRSPHYRHERVRAHIDLMNGYREGGQAEPLMDLLHETLYRNQGDLTASDLYNNAHAGTKHLVDEFFREVEASICFLAHGELPQIAEADRIDRFVNAAHTNGRSALLLSGGATLGFYHLGVAKALWEHGMLPKVISGSSMGALIAAAVCSRDDAQLSHLFRHPEEIDTGGLVPASLAKMWRNRSLLDPDILRRVIGAACGDITFAEAYAASGRILNISVSPTRTRQKPRVLNYQTAPEVTVGSACLASTAVPGLFPPVTLRRRSAGRAAEPYLPEEQWIDGSMQSDLPKRRLSRLQNVNHFIVSQTNPHVLPLLRLSQRRGMLPFAAGVGGRLLRAQGASVLDVAQQVGLATPLGPLLSGAHALLNQDYRGDIDIHPRFDASLYSKMISNVSTEVLQRFILEGERATWPRLAVVRNQTAISRALGRCVEGLDRRQLQS